MNKVKYAIVWMTLLLGWFKNTPEAIAQIDTIAYSLDTIVVSAKHYTTYLRGNANKSIRWNMDMLHNLPKIMGNADPMHYAQLLPGVQTCSEYNSGLYIQGCDNAHNLVSIEHVPIYNASHLLGFFSVFNASHFSQMNFSKTSQNSSVSNHLGGILSMQLPDSIVKRTNGEYSIGPMSSQGTLRLSLSRKSSLFVSLRAAYLNLLYGNWLEMDDNQLGYDFSDYNVTFLYAPNRTDQIKADLYVGHDKADLNESSYMAYNNLKWHNEKFSVSWKHRWQNDSELEQVLYYTGYHNKYHLQQANLKFYLPSSIVDYGYKGLLKFRQWQIGADLIYHRIQPQEPYIEGSFQDVVSSQPKQNALETALFIDYDKRFSLEWLMRLGTRFTYYNVDGRQYTSVDPMFTIAYTNDYGGNVNLNFRIQHQYLFKTGFSSMGLPTEFWFSANKKYKPQSSRSVSLAYDVPILGGNYKFYIEGYYKRLYNQVEYKGTLLDFLNSIYSLDNSLLTGSGENYGINVMLNKETGKITGWVSYTWGRALRRFNDKNFPDKYPANHERIHELNAAVTCQINSKWSVGATAVLASGTPFTPPKYIYLLGNHILAEYDEHNSSRLNPYFRMDLSVNYNLIKKGRRELGVNFSLYNVTSHSNDLYHRFSFDEKDKTYRYKPVRFVLDILPSFNIYHKF